MSLFSGRKTHRLSYLSRRLLLCQLCILVSTVKQVYKADKEVTALKGMKVDAFFYPKTETQRIDQQVFFKETLPRLKLYLENVLKEDSHQVESDVSLLIIHAR